MLEVLGKCVVAALTLYVFSLIPFIVTLCRRVAYFRRTIGDMPGPPSYWLVGSLPEFKGGLAAFPEMVLKHAANVIDKGENVMRTWMGPVLRLYTLDSESAKVILNSTVEIEKGSDYHRFDPWIGDGLVMSVDDHWRNTRKQLTPTFHFSKIEEYANVMDEQARKLIDVLDAKADGKMTNIYQTLKCVSLDIIAETAMGVSLNALHNADQPYTRAIGTYLKLNFTRGTHPLYLWGVYWELAGYARRARHALATILEMSTRVIRERMSIVARGVDQTGKRPDFLDSMLEEHAAGRLTFDQLRAETDTFLFGGYDTTAHALSWTLWCLATHPHIQERVYDEIISAYGHTDAEFASAASRDLAYLNAVIAESMRVYPPIPMIQRKMRNEVQIGRYTFPEGATVVIPFYAIHHNDKVYPNHWDFNPENFLGANNELSPFAYMPFSGGVRNCIGQKFAMRELRILLLFLLYNYKFTTTHAMTDNKPAIELVLIPTLGVPVQLTRRNKA